MNREIHITPEMLKRIMAGEPSGLDPQDEALFGGIDVDEEGGVSFERDSDSRRVPPAGVCLCCFDTGKRQLMFDNTPALGITTFVHSSEECLICRYHDEALDILPPMFHWVKPTALRPFVNADAKLNLPTKTQEALLNEILCFDVEGRSILYAGPSGVGKSVLSAALLATMVGVYAWRGWHAEYGEYRMPIYRINADQWIRQMQAFDTRDFQDSQVRPPAVNVETILRLCRRGATLEDPANWENSCDYNNAGIDWYPPVLLLEEIDKFALTKYKVDQLFALVNKIFEAKGMIISTSNLSPADLDARFRGYEYFLRRLKQSGVEAGDPKTAGKERVRDFYRYLASAAKKGVIPRRAKKPKTAS